MSKLIETVILVDTIMTDFNKRGVASDYAYYELLEQTQQYVTGHASTAEFVDYISFMFGVEDEKHFKRLKKAADKEYRYIAAFMDGTKEKSDETRM